MFRRRLLVVGLSFAILELGLFTPPVQAGSRRCPECIVSCILQGDTVKVTIEGAEAIEVHVEVATETASCVEGLPAASFEEAGPEVFLASLTEAAGCNHSWVSAVAFLPGEPDVIVSCTTP